MQYDPNEIFLRKALRGMSAVNTDERYKNSVNTVGDLLLDLMCFCKKHGIDFQRELKGAEKEFPEVVKGTHW